MKFIKSYFLLLLLFAAYSCTKLDESFRSELEQAGSGNITAAELLTSAYNSLNDLFQGDNPTWISSEVSTDEAIVPTRGPDWDDNGLFRAMHAHRWDADHTQIRNSYNSLLGTQFAASNVLLFKPSPQQAAEAKFIRALSMFKALDGWDQVPYREDLTNYKVLPKTLKGIEVVDFIVSELNSIMNDLPDDEKAYVANKNAARALLMKIYLNKGVYANRATPAFDAADMNQVITLADQITASNKYSLSDVFYDNFSPDNDTRSKENIYTLYNNAGERGGNVRGAVFMTSHYNMNPGGWNGFSTLSDFYAKFEATDQRRGMNYTYPGSLPNPQNAQNVGFLVGQQYDLTTGAPLQDRKGNPLSFTPEVQLRERGNDLEVTGIRVIKYPYDYATPGDQKNNDWSIFRYADVLLMKAEAMLRTGDAAGALAIVNSIRAKRGVTALPSLDETAMLDERGREMYWEGWRRQDLIRFGKFLQPWQEKAQSDPKSLLFPIPNNQLAVNPNLKQNPGY